MKKAIFISIFDLVCKKKKDFFQSFISHVKRKEIVSLFSFSTITLIANNKIKHVITLIVKKTQKNKKIRLKTFEKMYNKMKKEVKKRTNINFASQQNLSVLDFLSVFINFKINICFDFDIFTSRKVYFDFFVLRLIA